MTPLPLSAQIDRCPTDSPSLWCAVCFYYCATIKVTGNVYCLQFVWIHTQIHCRDYLYIQTVAYFYYTILFWCGTYRVITGITADTSFYSILDPDTSKTTRILLEKLLMSTEAFGNIFRFHVSVHSEAFVLKILTRVVDSLLIIILA